MFAALFRAGFFMVFLPYMAWLVVGEFLPNTFFEVPGVGAVSMAGIVALGLFVFGALSWVMSPTGRGSRSGGSGSSGGYWGDGGNDNGGSGCGSSGCGGCGS